MVDKYNPEDFERLKQEVETLVGRSIKTPKDFVFLSRQIEGYANETISVSTLKRMWGYVASPCKPSKYNLNLLSRFLRHSQIFEQLFVLINTKEVFWNIQALKYR